MKEMIKKVKERREGFTMAELLIVVAIIAVLVAIAIPVFTSQLEKSAEAADLANIRAAYAECAAKTLTDKNSTTYYKVVDCKQTKDNWTIDVSDVAGQTLSTTFTYASGSKWYVAVDADSVIHVTYGTTAPSGYTLCE